MLQKNALYSYYDHYHCSYVLDRGDWGKPGNLQYLKDLNIPRKFVILYRPVFECLASTLKAMNSFDEKLCDDLMSTKLNLGNYIWSIENITTIIMFIIRKQSSSCSIYQSLFVRKVFIYFCFIQTHYSVYHLNGYTIRCYFYKICLVN